MKINEKIRERRLELGLTLEKVANAVGVAKSTVKKWESGQIETMKGSKIVLLSQVLQVPPLYLVYEEEELDRNPNVSNGIVGNGNHHNTVNVGEQQPTQPTAPIVSAIVTVCNNLTDEDQAKVLAFAATLLSGKKES